MPRTRGGMHQQHKAGLREQRFKRKTANYEAKQKNKRAKHTLATHQNLPLFRFSGQIIDNWYTRLVLLLLVSNMVVDAAEFAKDLEKGKTGEATPQIKGKETSEAEATTQIQAAKANPSKDAATAKFVKTVATRILSNDPNKAVILEAAKKIPAQERWAVEQCLKLEPKLKIQSADELGEALGLYYRELVESGIIRTDGDKDVMDLYEAPSKISLKAKGISDETSTASTKTDLQKLGEALRHESLHCADYSASKEPISIEVKYYAPQEQDAYEATLKFQEELALKQSYWYQNKAFYEKEIDSFNNELSTRLDKTTKENNDYFFCVGIEFIRNYKDLRYILIDALPDVKKCDDFVEKEGNSLLQNYEKGKKPTGSTFDEVFTIGAVITRIASHSMLIVGKKPHEFVAHLSAFPDSLREAISPRMNKVIHAMVDNIKERAHNKLATKASAPNRIVLDFDEEGNMAIHDADKKPSTAGKNPQGKKLEAPQERERDDF